MATTKRIDYRSKAKDFQEKRRLGGRPVTSVLNASELEELFDLYLEFMEENVWYKKEVIKGGERAGDIIDVAVPTILSIEGFCLFAGISRTGFFFECTNPKNESGIYAEFKDVATYIREYIANQQFEGGSVGAYNSSIVMRKLNLTDSVKLSGDEEASPIKVQNITGMVIK